MLVDPRSSATTSMMDRGVALNRDNASGRRIAVGLSLQGVSISRRGLLLVEDLWLDVATDETVAVMGPSGAGKTTLLRSVAGLTTDFDGHISNATEGRSAVVFQDPRLLPWRTALANVELACSRENRHRAREWLTSVGLGDAVDLFPAQMSGGMRQRVAVARALAFDASVIVVDEPFASLDAATATALRDDVVDHLATVARTVLWVTHDRNEADAVADRILVLDGPPTGTWHLTRASRHINGIERN